MAAMGHEMGHGPGMSHALNAAEGMEGMVRDMRNRFFVAFVLTIPVFLYSPLYYRLFNFELPTPLGISPDMIAFMLATPVVLYGGWPFFVGAYRALKNGVLNMAVSHHLRQEMTDRNVALDGLGQQAQEPEGSGQTVVYAAVDGKPAGLIAIADAVRSGAQTTIDALHGMGIEVAMLTGDNRGTAQRVAQELGIDTVFAEVLPDQKQDRVKELQARRKFVAVETADVVLMKSDPLSRRVFCSTGPSQRYSLPPIRHSAHPSIGQMALLGKPTEGVYYEKNTPVVESRGERRFSHAT